MPSVGRVLETSLYVDDVRRSVEFYRRLFAFETLLEDARLTALSVAGQQVLLIFRKGASSADVHLPGGVLPGHDGSGTTHLAFTIDTADEQAWIEKLKDAGVPLESRVDWPRGGWSLYFRDPDGHLLELVAPGCWAIY